MKVALQIILCLVFAASVWGNEEDPLQVTSDSLNVRLVAEWPVGPSYAIETDEERDLVFIGGEYDSVFILDASDPSSLVRISAIPSTNQWNKGLFYKNQYLYIGEWNSFRVVSVVNPLNPAIVGEIADLGVAQSITVEDTVAYVSCDLFSGHGFIQFLSVADPANPYIIGEYRPSEGTPWQVVVEDSLAYVADEGGGLLILSVASPSNSYEVGHYQTYETIGLALRGTLAYLADHRGLIVVNISNPRNPVEESILPTPGYPTNLILDNFLIYLADREGGFRVISLSDPLNPLEVGYYQTVDRAWSVAYLAPYAYVTTEIEGLSIFHYLDPTSIGDKADDGIAVPAVISLFQNHPNPFNPSTTIDYSIASEGRAEVRLTVNDLRGRLVRILVNEMQEAGHHCVHWDGKDSSGREVASGIYIYRVEVGGIALTRKMIISQ